jgi:hypothetical protein
MHILREACMYFAQDETSVTFANHLAQLLMKFRSCFDAIIGITQHTRLKRQHSSTVGILHYVTRTAHPAAPVANLEAGGRRNILAITPSKVFFFATNRVDLLLLTLSILLMIKSVYYHTKFMVYTRRQMNEN